MSGGATAGEQRVVLRLVGDAARDVVLDHGAQPDDVLAGLGLRVERAVSAQVTGPAELTITLAVTPRAAVPLVERPVRRDADMTDADVRSAVRRRRPAAYALVRQPGGTADPLDDLVLLTVLSDRAYTAPGAWTMPGGGLDPGEDPTAACIREVWEETGQRVTDLHLLGVTSDRWFGRAPNGVVEDFQPIRLLYAAVCPEPGEPVVHDVGGTTERAEWVRVRDILDPAFPLVGSWAQRLREALA